MIWQNTFNWKLSHIILWFFETWIQITLILFDVGIHSSRVLVWILVSHFQARIAHIAIIFAFILHLSSIWRKQIYWVFIDELHIKILLFNYLHFIKSFADLMFLIHVKEKLVECFLVVWILNELVNTLKLFNFYFFYTLIVCQIAYLISVWIMFVWSAQKACVYVWILDFIFSKMLLNLILNYLIV